MRCDQGSLKDEKTPVFIVLAILSVSLLNGCLERSTIMDEDDGVRTEVVGKDTIRNVETIYGEVNVSHAYNQIIKGRQCEDLLNITVFVENPTPELYFLHIEYVMIDVDGHGSGVGGGPMDRLDDHNFFSVLSYTGRSIDLFIRFYEKREKVWNETVKEYGYTSERTEVIGATISVDHPTEQSEREIAVRDIEYGFELINGSQVFEITYNISSDAAPRSTYIHLIRELRNGGTSGSSGGFTYASENNSYCAVFEPPDRDFKETKTLIFSVSVFTYDKMRVTSQAIIVSLDE